MIRLPEHPKNWWLVVEVQSMRANGLTTEDVEGRAVWGRFESELHWEQDLRVMIEDEDVA